MAPSEYRKPKKGKGGDTCRKGIKKNKESRKIDGRREGWKWVSTWRGELHNPASQGQAKKYQYACMEYRNYAPYEIIVITEEAHNPSPGKMV